MPRVSRCKQAHNGVPCHVYHGVSKHITVAGGRGEDHAAEGERPWFCAPPPPPDPSLSAGRQQRCGDRRVVSLLVLGRVMTRDSLQWRSVCSQHGGLAARAAAGFPADVNHGSHVQLVLQVQTTHRTLLTQSRHQLAFTSGALF